MSGLLKDARKRYRSTKAKYDKVKVQYDNVRGKYDKFKEYYDLVNNLLNEDTRGSTIAQESVNMAIKLGERMMGRTLANHPYFKYHEQHLKMLWSAIEAADTAANARAALEEAIEMVDRVRKESQALSRKYNPKYAHLRARVASKVSGHPFYWHKYLRDLSRYRFDHSNRQDIYHECYFVMTEKVVPMMYALTPEIAEIKKSANTVLIEYGAVMAYSRSIQVLADKYRNKVSGLQDSGKSIGVVMGKGEERRRNLEKASALGNPRSKANQARLDPVKAARDAMKTARRCASDWMFFAELARGIHILMVGVPGGAMFPWEMAARMGIRVPGFK